MTAVISQEWSDIGEAEAIPEGEARAFEVGAHRICVVRHEGAFYAISDMCSHGYAFLSEGYCDIGECVMECPLHGGLFDFRTGAAVGKPAEHDIAAYPVKVVEGRLLVQVARD